MNDRSMFFTESDSRSRGVPHRDSPRYASTSYVRSRGLQAAAANAPMMPRPFLYSRRTPGDRTAANASSFETIRRTAFQYKLAAGWLGRMQNPGLVVGSWNSDRLSTRRATRARRRQRSSSPSAQAWDQMGRPSSSPIRVLRPAPCPNRTQIAPLPRVFHGTFGFNRTRRG